MTNKINLLLAEDEASLGIIIKESLESRNFTVTLCENGEFAFEEFRKSNFDALVLDIMMPKKDGFTLAEEIRQINKTIPILFLTSKSIPIKPNWLTIIAQFAGYAFLRALNASRMENIII